MNIIKSSKIPMILECTCIFCASVLGVEPQDVKTSDVGFPYSSWFKCPVCGTNNSIANKIPKSWIGIIYKDDPI